MICFKTKLSKCKARTDCFMLPLSNIEIFVIHSCYCGWALLFIYIYICNQDVDLRWGDGQGVGLPPLFLERRVILACKIFLFFTPSIFFQFFLNLSLLPSPLPTPLLLFFLPCPLPLRWFKFFLLSNNEWMLVSMACDVSSRSHDCYLFFFLFRN